MSFALFRVANADDELADDEDGDMDMDPPEVDEVLAELGMLNKNT